MTKKLQLNTISSLILQVLTIVSGFIIPRLIIGQYGSSINGLVSSITQFIAVISFLELGVGKVVQSSLYAPLAINDDSSISRIIVSANRFFNHFAQIMLVYIVILIIVYPFITNNEYNWLFSAALISTMSISYFAQYYFGITNNILLTADQRGYIQYFTQSLTIILNTLACIYLIKNNYSIQIVKLTTSIIFLIRPLFLKYYVASHYSIDKAIEIEEEPIKQKWNGLAQHIAYVVLNNTDTIILTIFATFSEVSIYSVYNLVVMGVKQLFTSTMNGVESLFGNLWATKDHLKLDHFFSRIEWLVHTGVVFIFGCTGFLVLSFVQVYTKGISDANYYQPVFAVLIVSAHASHCLRLPYNLMIFAAGHYKQTQNNYIISTIINILISLACVKSLGLIGVAIGTLVAMTYQTVWMAIYNSRYLVKRKISVFLKQMMVDFLTVMFYTFIPFSYKLSSLTYYSWFFLALRTFICFAAITIIVNCVFYKMQTVYVLNIIKSTVLKHS